MRMMSLLQSLRLAAHAEPHFIAETRDLLSRARAAAKPR
jgi:hypothetical protein